MNHSFKKIALLGIASGFLVAQPAHAEDEGLLSISQRNSCKGQGGCGGDRSSCKGKGGCGGDRSSCKGKGGCGGDRSSCKGNGGCGGEIADNETPQKKIPVK